MQPEPDLSNIDEQTRRKIQKQIKRMRKRFGQTHKRGRHVDHSATKVPVNIRLENGRSKAKAAKKARRTNRR